MSESELKLLASSKKPCTYKKNQKIFEQGDVVSGIYCNSNGLVKVIQKDSSEKILFSRLAFPGDSVGYRSLFIEKNYKGTATMVSDQGQGCFISHETVSQLFLQNPSFAKALVKKISFELERSVDEKIELKEKSTFARLCYLLINLFEEFSEETVDGHLSLKSDITKVEIAQILAVADETVIRHMSELKNDKVIQQNGKRLTLINRKQLERLAQL